MPAIKRKIAPEIGSKQSDSSKKSKQSKGSSASNGKSTLIPTATKGMLERAMEDDMIDDEDDDSEDMDGADDTGSISSEGDDAADGAEEFGSGMEESGGEEQGFEDLESEEEADKPAATARGKSKSLYRPPTMEEMEVLRAGGEGESAGQGEGGFEFSMKLEALLKSTFLDPLPSSSKSFTPSPPPSTLTTFLTSLHAHILALPTLEPVRVSRAVERLSPSVIPFLDPAPTGAMGSATISVKQAGKNKAKQAEIGEGEPNWLLGFEKPKEIFVAGDWTVMGSYKAGVREFGEAGVSEKVKGKKKEVLLNAVDLVVVMPDAMFTPKDRTANRYFHKRAHYLAVIANSLVSRIATANKNATKKAKGADDAAGGKVWKDVKVEWEYANGNERRPVVVLEIPKNKALGLGHSYTIRILAGLASDALPLSSLQPSKSNLRVQAVSNEESTTSPTPVYNTSILLDTVAKAHLLWLNNLQKSSPSLRSALALWRVWGDRRGLTRRAGKTLSFSELGAMIMGLVIDGGHYAETGKDGVRKSELRARKGLGRGLSEWQLLRAAWEVLASTDFKRNPTYMKHLSDADSIPPTDFLKAFEYILVDPTGKINVLAGREVGEIESLAREAKVTLDMLRRATTDRFDDLFMSRIASVDLRYDENMQFDVTLEERRNFDLAGITDDTVHAVGSLLRRGLGKRVNSIAVTSATPVRWSTSQQPQAASNSIQVGLLLNPEYAFGVLDQGPPSEDEAGSQAFRQLWGEKAELRRFKDGSITESVVWNVEKPEERVLIPAMIVRWLLQRHFAVDSEDIAWRGMDWLPITQKPQSAHRLVHTAGSEKGGFRPIMEAFDELYKVIKASDDDLPLSILNFTPISPSLRYTSAFIPYATDVTRIGTSPDCLKYVPAASVLIQFESSRRWPDDLIAIQKIKLAFMAKLSDMLQEKIDGLRTSIVLDPSAPDIQDHAALEVLMPSGFVFLLHIYHDREKTLLERMVEDPALPSEKLRAIATSVYESYFRRFIAGPRHHAAISTLHHQFPSYAASCRLLKRWIAAQMLSNHIPEEFLELVSASVYLEPGSFAVPTTMHTGFLRALHLLAHWDWKRSPLLVPLYAATVDQELQTSVGGKFPAEKRQKALSLFQTQRNVDRDFVKSTMVIATEEDLLGRSWLSVGQPHRLIANRICSLAKASLGLLEQPKWQISQIFITDLQDYDLVLHLNPVVVSRLAENVGASYNEAIQKRWENHVRNQVAAGLAAGGVKAQFDPVAALLAELEHLYSQQIVLFNDKHGGLSICGLWNPGVLHHRTFKPFLGYSVKLVTNAVQKDSMMTALNKEAILGEIERLGSGIITRIDVADHE